MTSEWPLIVQGDAEGACIDLLTLADEIQDFTPITVSSNMNNFNVGDSRIMVVQEGGALPWPYKADKPRIDFNCLAATRPLAKQIALVAQAVMLRSIGDYTGFGLRIIDVKVETGIFRIPDKDSDSHRYSFSLRLTCVPNP